MKLLDFYGNWLSNVISYGALVKKENLDSFSIRPAYNKMVTRKSATMIWVVTDIPVDFKSNLTHVIRTYVHDNFPGIKSTIHYHSDKEIVNTNSKPFIRRKEKSIENFDEYRDALEGLSEARRQAGRVFRFGGRQFTLNRAGLKELMMEMNSYLYIDEAKSKAQGIYTTTYFIRLSASEISEINKVSGPFTDYLSKLGLEAYPVYGDLNNYMVNYGPTTLNNGDTRKFFPFLTTDENLAALAPTMTRGMVGTGKGPMIGMDIFSKLPVHLDMFSTSNGQVFLVAAPAGSGKTILIELLVPAVRILGVHVSVIDMKGNEWERMFPFIGPDHKKIDVDGGTWVNTMRLDDLEIDSDEEAEEMYDTAVNATVQWFLKKVGILSNHPEIYDITSFISEAIKKVFNTAHVSKHDFDTFKYTAKLNPSMVVSILNEMDVDSLTESQANILKTIVRRAKGAFDADNLDPEKEVTLSEIIDVGYLVYAFNLVKGNMSYESVGPKLVMIEYLDSKKRFSRKKNKLHTVKIIEEVQSANKSDGELSIFGHITETVAIGRSENVSVFMLTNSVSVLNRPELRAVQSNISGLIIGKVIEADLEIIQGLQGGKLVTPLVESLIEDESERLANCFALYMNSGTYTSTTMIKAVIPEEIREELRQRDLLIQE